VILVDANILIYAYNTAAEQHEAARAWTDAAFSGDETVGLAWPVIHAFLRLATNPRVFPEPLTIEECVAIVDEWLALPNIVILNPGRIHWQRERRILMDAQVRRDVVTDAHLAALAVENDATICTADRDFRRFEGVRVINPVSM